MIIRV